MSAESAVDGPERNITRERAALDRSRCAYLSGPYLRGYAGKGTTGSEEVMARCLLDRGHSEERGHLIEQPGGQRSRVWPEPEEVSA